MARLNISFEVGLDTDVDPTDEESLGTIVHELIAVVSKGLYDGESVKNISDDLGRNFGLDQVSGVEYYREVYTNTGKGTRVTYELVDLSHIDFKIDIRGDEGLDR